MQMFGNIKLNEDTEINHKNNFRNIFIIKTDAKCHKLRNSINYFKK